MHSEQQQMQTVVLLCPTENSTVKLHECASKSIDNDVIVVYIMVIDNCMVNSPLSMAYTCMLVELCYKVAYNRIQKNKYYVSSAVFSTILTLHGSWDMQASLKKHPRSKTYSFTVWLHWGDVM